MRSYGEIEVNRSGIIAVPLESKKLRLSSPVPTGDSANGREIVEAQPARPRHHTSTEN
jgi:acetolactate synthase-1/3 small subunit